MVRKGMLGKMPDIPLAPRVPEEKKEGFRSMMDAVMRPANSMMVWKTNQHCNFRCRYCFCSERKLAREHPLCGRHPPRRIARSFDRTGREWTILMTGGEPFLYPDFIDLCLELSKKHLIALNTNLSTANVARFADEVDPRRVVLVNAAFHSEELERRRRNGDFLKHVRHFQEKGFPLCLEYVAYPPRFNRIDRDLRRLEEAGVRFVNLKVFRGIYGGRQYPASYSFSQREVFQIRGLDDREVEFIDKRFSYFGKLCDAGRNSLFMEISGNLRRCPGSAKSYGNLFRGSFVLDEEPRPCPFPRCFSPWIGRNYARGSTASSLSTLKEVVRQGLPFLMNTGKVRESFRSLWAQLQP